jgi:glycosyltransferase involved in cell wall biosynthesis
MNHKLHIGIDASNIRAGGGITHLYELLNSTNPELNNISQITVWSNYKTLSSLPDKAFLKKNYVKLLDKNIVFRIYWILFIKNNVIKKSDIDILFIPGGTDFSSFIPKVSMSQNLLPFEIQELKRYGYGINFFKGLLLRLIQTYTFKKSQGLIFLTPYARNAVLKVTGILNYKDKIIPHGINDRFRNNEMKMHRPFEDFTKQQPCRILYVSIIEIYKHQWNVIDALNLLEQRGYNVRLDLVGPLGPGKNKLFKALNSYNLIGNSITYHGSITYEKIEALYKIADIGVFASSCETFGQIITESMASKLPLACSNLSSMKDILELDGVYFNPENHVEICDAIEKLLLSKTLRSKHSESAFNKSKVYTWNKCSFDTFNYISEVYYKNLKK